ncbi:hypothetical protein VTK56DRAFT_1158 [Thermocarpiscus australiensis]
MREVTMPNVLLPSPRRAKYRSVFSSGEAVMDRPSAETISNAMTRSAAIPYWPDSGVCPPAAMYPPAYPTLCPSVSHKDHATCAGWALSQFTPQMPPSTQKMDVGSFSLGGAVDIGEVLCVLPHISRHQRYPGCDSMARQRELSG